MLTFLLKCFLSPSFFAKKRIISLKWVILMDCMNKSVNNKVKYGDYFLKFW